MWQCESAVKWNGERRGELHAGGNPPIPFALNECRRIPNQWSPESLLSGAVASAVLTHVIETMYRDNGFRLSAYISSVLAQIDNHNGASSVTGITIRISATVKTTREATELDKVIRDCSQTCGIVRSLNCPVRIESNIVQRQKTKDREVQYG